MQFPAIIEEQMIQELPPAEITDPLTLAIKTKFQSIKKKKQAKYRFTKNYHIVDVEVFNQHKEKFLNHLKSVKEGQTQGLQEYYPLIFGLLEGTSSNTDPMSILAKYFGSDVDKIQLTELIKQKTKSINYGNDKRKDSNIRQVSDKKIFESTSIFFDLKEIRAHRKMCSSVRNYLKALKKFKDCIENSLTENQSVRFTEDSEQNKSYIQYVTQQLNFNKLKLPNEFTYQKQQEVIEEKEQIVQKSEPKYMNTLQKFLAVTPLKKIQQQNNAKMNRLADTSQPKGQNNNEKQINMENQQENQQKGGQEDKQGKVKKVRRSKEQVQRDRLAKQMEREQKRKQQQRKKAERVAKQQEIQRQKEEKERQKQLQRLAKQKQKQAKQLEKQMKERQKQAQKQAKEAQRQAKETQRLLKQKERLAKEDERRAKQAEKIAIQKAKQQKENKQKQSFGSFFVKKIASIPASPEKKTQVLIQEKKEINVEQNQKQWFVSLIKTQQTEIYVCRSEFRSNKMKDQSYTFQTYYTNVITGKSRLEFKNYKVNEQRFDNYYEPHFETELCKYDDSSIEYEDICGDICNQEIDMMSEDQEGSFNSAIVNDSYIEDQQLSSAQDQRNHVVIKISQGVQWYFSDPNHKYVELYTMFGLHDDQILPLELHQEQQSNEPSINLKCQLYKEIHGYFGPKQPLIRKMSSIADRIPKSSLDTIIKQTTTKKGNQRLVKPQIIDFLNEQKQGFAKQLEEIKAKRDQQNMAEMKGKLTEKQRQIQNLILHEAGTYYIIDLLQFLRQKGYRMRKRDLQQFIDIRSGPQWDDIRTKMKKMNLKQKEKLNKYFKKDEKGEKQAKQQKEQENAVYEQNEMKPQDQNLVKEQKFNQNAMKPE